MNRNEIMNSEMIKVLILNIQYLTTDKKGKLDT